MSKFAVTNCCSEKPGEFFAASYLRMISAGSERAVASANVLLSGYSRSVWTRWNSSP
jgi:hypothetical protein